MALLPALYEVPLLLMTGIIRRNYLKAFLYYEAIGQE